MRSHSSSSALSRSGSDFGGDLSFICAGERTRELEFLREMHDLLADFRPNRARGITFPDPQRRTHLQVIQSPLCELAQSARRRHIH
jgi:hypothetical protein